MVENYLLLYSNLEVRVLDMNAQGLFEPKDALDMLVSYAIAEEGSNTLYINLVELLLKRQEEYNLVEVEMILNYFPHSIWKNEESLARLRTYFYAPITQKITENIDKFGKR